MGGTQGKTYGITFSKLFEKQLSAIDKSPRTLIISKIEGLKSIDLINDKNCTRVRSAKMPTYRYRINDWRLFFTVMDGGLQLYLLEILRKNEDTYK